MAVLMFGGTYYDTVSDKLSYEEYFESKIKKEEWDKINLENADHRDVVLHIRKDDAKWFSEKREKEKKAHIDLERLLRKKSNDFWIEAFEERMNEESGNKNL